MKTLYLTIATILLFQVIKAQNSIRPNIYLQNMQYYNPAAVAIDSNQHLQTAVYVKHRFVDNEDAIWNKPMNLWLSHAGRIGNTNSFYTVSYVNDRYSFFNRNAFYLGYVRRSNIGVSSLSYGGRIVANMDAINWDKFELPHDKDGKTLRFNPDLDIGVVYQYKRFNAGIGLKNLIGMATKTKGATLLRNHREVNINLSYRQNIGGQFAITPFTLLAHERNTLIDAGLCFTVFNRIRASYALRVNELKSVITLDADIYKGWSAGVAYDRSSLVSDNNFDLVVRYRR
ncbi:MAG: type IX secretion system membrane protein PorP/SprF [Terrimonas sp.]|nr:type IX secretion system membrane protein PorP/SprF [Terrimonas sp.]OJY89406.1 MAG: hypothetical protein BGP13_02825 [Sphingobacteriales bacterium 40-81]